MSRFGDETGLLWVTPERTRGGTPPPRVITLPQSDWRPPEDFPDLQQFPQLAIDLETKDPQLKAQGPGVRRPGNFICGVAIGCEAWDRYYPIRHEGGGNLDPVQVMGWLRDELNQYRGEIVGANLLYEMDWLANDGITFPHVKAFHDVQVCEPLIDEWRFSYALDSLAADYLGVHKEETLLRQAALQHGWNTDRLVKENLWRLPSNMVGPYAEGDVILPRRILPLQLKKIADEKIDKIYDIERRLIPLLLGMRRRGVPVDINEAQRVRELMVKQRDKWLNEARRLAGPKVELMQPNTFAKYLMERGLNVPLTKETKQPSITKPFLARNAHDPFINCILQGRTANTVINTFLDGHILGHAISGRIHCQFNQLKGEDGGTIARFSSSNPNLQNLPARDEETAPLVRGIFKPEAGEKWQRDDYSQIEYRLLVHFAVGRGSVEARAQYNDDPKTDFHALVSEWMGIDPSDKIQRRRVKGVNFGKTYGAQAPKLAVILNCTIDEAYAFVKKYEERLPFAHETFNAASNWAGKNGWVKTVLGRIQRFTLWEPWDNHKRKDPVRPLPREAAVTAYGHNLKRFMCHAALNRKLQGSGADIMKKSMVDVMDSGIMNVLGYPLLTVHDELDISVPQTKEGKEAARELTKIMSDAVTLKVPVLVDSSQGDDWGQCA